MNNSIKIEAREKLEENLNKIIKNENENKELNKILKDEFIKKNLNANLIYSIFTEGTQWNTLNDMEKIAFITGCYMCFKIELLNPKLLFSEVKLLQYDEYELEKENKIELLKFNCFIRNDTSDDYLGRLSYKDIYLYRKNGLLFYNLETQRASETITIGAEGLTLRKMKINYKNVDQIAELMLKGEYEPDTLIFNSRLIDKKEMQFKEDVISEEYNLCNITIKPDYDVDSKSQTVVDILDGMHRILGICKAVEIYKDRTGKWLEGYMPVRLVVRDTKAAKRIVAQTFERSDTDIEWKVALKSDENFEFMQNIINKVDFGNGKLSDYVADTFSEMKTNNSKITYKNILYDAIKECKINYKSISIKKQTEANIVEILNYMFDYIINDDFNGDFDRAIKSEMFEYNMVFGYIIMAYNMRRRKYDDIVFACENLYEDIKNNAPELFKSLKFKNKIISKNKAINYFKKIVNDIEVN